MSTAELRGVVLAGGTGSRLFPLTKVTNKHLLPVGRDPMIFHPVRKLIQAGFTAEAVCQPGKPAEEIMKVAAKQHAELIVMGAQGRGAIARFLLGSVSTRVVQHANCAVLVVRSQTKHRRSVLDRFPGVSSGVIG